MAAISQTTISIVFSWMKMLEFRLNFHWSLFLRIQLTIFHHWFRYWLGAVQATSHYLSQWWLVYWSINASLGLNELTNYTLIPAGLWIIFAVIMIMETVVHADTTGCFTINISLVNSSPPGQNGCHLADDIFKCIFLNRNDRIQILLKFVLKSPIDKPALLQVMAWCRTGDKPLPEPMVTQFTDAYIWGTRWRWVICLALSLKYSGTSTMSADGLVPISI